jgi:hypothetical protein
MGIGSSPWKDWDWDYVATFIHSKVLAEEVIADLLQMIILRVFIHDLIWFHGEYLLCFIQTP